MKIYKTNKELTSDLPVIILHYFIKTGKNSKKLQLSLEVNDSDIIRLLSETLSGNSSTILDNFITYILNIPENTEERNIDYVVEFTIYRDNQRIIKLFIITQSTKKDRFQLCVSRMCSSDVLN